MTCLMMYDQTTVILCQDAHGWDIESPLCQFLVWCILANVYLAWHLSVMIHVLLCQNMLCNKTVFMLINYVHHIHVDGMPCDVIREQSHLQWIWQGFVSLFWNIIQNKKTNKKHSVINVILVESLAIKHESTGHLGAVSISDWYKNSSSLIMFMKNIYIYIKNSVIDVILVEYRELSINMSPLHVCV